MARGRSCLMSNSLGVLLDRELTERDDRRLWARLGRHAAVEDVDYPANRRCGTSPTPTTSTTAQ